PEGRLAFILPADVCEGVFAPMLWRWIVHRFDLEAVITFTTEASPFPRVDTNALVFLIRNAPPRDSLRWATVKAPWTDELTLWVRSGFSTCGPSLIVTERKIQEALATGLSRPRQENEPDAYGAPILSDFAKVQRGIATGSNEFFFLKRQEVDRLSIGDEFLLRAVGRTRDVLEPVIINQSIVDLEQSGRPTSLLFAPAK
ncbi:MAG: SAM-dependent methyltransferase, partial [Cytophagales bacterium]|nr:SAM-dependent methyltransferase [Armatimonadota bacterium]